MKQKSKEELVVFFSNKYKNKQLLAPRDVMEILNISLSTLNRMVKNDALNPYFLDTNSNHQTRRFDLEQVLSCLKTKFIY